MTDAPSNKPCRCCERLLLATAAAVFLLPVLFGWLGIRINITPSVPGWFYQQQPASRADLKAGQMVLVCPPDNLIFQEARRRGYVRWGLSCPGFYAPLLKPIAAIAGDKVEITPDGIRAGWKVIPNSKRMAADGRGRPMPKEPADGIVPLSHVWLVSDYNPKSFDSRYFGAIHVSQIIGKAAPLLRAKTPPQPLILQYQENNKENS